MIESLITRPAVITYSSASDEINEETGAKTRDPLTIETVGYLEPKRTDEPANHPDISDSDWTGYFLPRDGGELDSASQVWAPGIGTFKVVGRPPVWADPMADQEMYVEVNLKQVAGPDDDRSQP